MAEISSVGRSRRRPFGAEILDDGAGAHFRVWGPRARSVEVVLEGGPGRGTTRALEKAADGFWSGPVAGAGVGSLYRYKLPDGLFPDPASRFQPQGPAGPSEIVETDGFAWTDASWPGIELRGQVLSEIHIGTLTPEGTWAAAGKKLHELVDVGITAVQVMPVGEFPGAFGWGYDGVQWFAPYHGFGRPEDFQRFVNTAHGLGLGVVLDVVYNHFGPESNWMERFTECFTNGGQHTEWGASINFDGGNCEPVRAFVLASVAQWVEDYHVDGLRLDATQAFFDRSGVHILTEIGQTVRNSSQGRRTIVMGENEPQESQLVRPIEQGGMGLDAVWSEDFHHVAVQSVLGRREAYYSDYRGTPQELISLLKRGFLYQGQRNIRQGKRRGTFTKGVPLERFVNYLENHDQVSNSLRGERLVDNISPAAFRAITGVFLLAPGTPLMFQGQESGASGHFFYFSDHEPGLSAKMREGRKEQVSQFASLATPESQAALPDPSERSSFERSRLRPGPAERERRIRALHRDLIRLRRHDPTFSLQGEVGIDGAVLGEASFVVRYEGRSEREDRLMVVNLGKECRYAPISEPLLAAPPEMDWKVIWSSESLEYGGSGTPPPAADDGWNLPGWSTLVLAAAGQTTGTERGVES